MGMSNSLDYKDIGKIASGESIQQGISSIINNIKEKSNLIPSGAIHGIEAFANKASGITGEAIAKAGLGPTKEVNDVIGDPNRRNLDTLLTKAKDMKKSSNEVKLWWLFQKIADFFNWIWTLVKKVYHAIIPESIQKLLRNIVKNVKYFFAKVWESIKQFFHEVFKSKPESKAHIEKIRQILEADNNPNSAAQSQKKVEYVKKQIFSITLTISALIIVYILIKYFIKNSQYHESFNIIKKIDNSKKTILEQESGFNSPGYSILSVLFKMLLWPFKTILADYSETMSKAYDQSGKIKNKYDVYVQVLVIAHMALIVLLGVQIKDLIS